MDQKIHGLSNMYKYGMISWLVGDPLLFLGLFAAMHNDATAARLPPFS
jgi:hypothetical protein